MTVDIFMLAGGLQVVAYIKVASFFLFVYDWVISVDQEVQHVWKSRWSWAKVIFLFCRYSPLCDTSIAVFERWSVDSELCGKTMAVATIAAGVGMGVSEILLMLRTYALYGQSRKIFILFALLWMIVSVVEIWAGVRWTKSLAVVGPPPGAFGCYLDSSGSIGLICYIMFLIVETIIVSMTLFKAVKTAIEMNGHSTKFLTSFYRDGLIYYLCLLPMTIANVVLLVVSPPGYQLLMDTPLRVFHAILSCRLFLHCRAVAEEDRGNSSNDVSTIGFASSVPEQVSASSDV